MLRAWPGNVSYGPRTEFTGTRDLEGTMTTQQDLEQLRRMATIAAPGTLRDVIQEVLSVVPLVMQWTAVQTSGSAVCRYNHRTGARQYEVRYQIGDLGNLVHELTHVAVNEAYGLDFINYPNPKANLAKVPAREFDGVGRCRNEELRQAKQMDQARNVLNGSTLNTLVQWAAAANELKAEQQKQIQDKLTYGMMSPQKEYDTVINQVLVWLFQWGYPVKGASAKKPVVNALYEEVEKAAGAAHDERERETPRTFIRESAVKRRAAMGYR